MISWIEGEIILSWDENQKHYILINCQGIGYEIQTIQSLENKNKNIILWIHHLKKEDSDSLFGFLIKEERDFFRDLIKVKGIGPQIGISLLKKYSFDKVIKSLVDEDKNLINSVSGIGPKMTDRIFFEFKNKFAVKYKNISSDNSLFNFEQEDIQSILDDLNSALSSLSYPKKDIKDTILSIKQNISTKNLSKSEIIEKYSFENLLKKALNNIDKNNNDLV